MRYWDTCCFQGATEIPAVFKVLQGYLLFSRIYRDTCCFQESTGIPAVLRHYRITCCFQGATGIPAV
jgi:hypothetical protein